MTSAAAGALPALTAAAALAGAAAPRLWRRQLRRRGQRPEGRRPRECSRWPGFSRPGRSFRDVRPRSRSRCSMPNGKPLTQYKTGLRAAHRRAPDHRARRPRLHHPPAPPDRSGRAPVARPSAFPAPGAYRVLVDVYPNIPGGQPNFQLFKTVDVTRRATSPERLPRVQARPGRRRLSHRHAGAPDAPRDPGRVRARRRARSRTASKVTFVPWFGALAHAIFFHQGSLDYFHTHVCGAGAPNCTSAIGATRVTGRATAPGKLTLGVLLPVPGTWRLFLQMKLGGRVVTAPYTLNVGA